MKILASAFAVAALALQVGCSTPPRSAAERADAVLRDLADRHLFQGAAVFGRGGVVEYAEGFGFADVERRVPFTPATPTDGASIAKTFTATALLLLAGEGRIDLEARVREFLPTFPHAATRVRHLLAHSAGLPSYEWLDSRVTPDEPRTNASHLAVVARDAPTPSFPPGTSFEYDNVAYDVAAMVVERVTDSSFADLVTARFSRPLGLETFVRPARFSEWSGTRTRGYRRTASGFADHDAYDLEGFYGADNIYLSARDLYRWVAGYRDLLGATTSRVAVDSTTLDDGRATGISRGSWYVSSDGNRRYYTGHHNGFFNFGYADDGRSLAVAWVANDAPPPWLQPALSRALIAIAEGRDPEPLVPPAAADTTVDPSGVYRVPRVGEAAVRHEGDRLVVRLRGVDYDAFPVAPGVRYLPGLDGYLRFARAPNGQITLSWDSVFIVAASVARVEP
ncbi:MAG: serine hydrolase domain-containing protein [Gemmatimonadales bacterium]